MEAVKEPGRTSSGASPGPLSLTRTGRPPIHPVEMPSRTGPARWGEEELHRVVQDVGEGQAHGRGSGVDRWGRSRGLDLHAQPAAARLPCQAPDSVFDDGQQGVGRRLLARPIVGVQMGQGGSAFLRELRKALDFLQARAERLLVLRGVPRTTQRDLDLGPQPQERRAQLVRGIRREPPLGLHPMLHPGQHGVVGVLDEAPELVLGRGLPAGARTGSTRRCGEPAPRSPPRATRLSRRGRRSSRPRRSAARRKSVQGRASGRRCGSSRIVEGAGRFDGVAAARGRDRECGEADALFPEVLESLEHDSAGLSRWWVAGYTAKRTKPRYALFNSKLPSRSTIQSNLSRRRGRKARRFRGSTRAPAADAAGRPSSAEASVSANAAERGVELAEHEPCERPVPGEGPEREGAPRPRPCATRRGDGGRLSRVTPGARPA